MTAHPLVEMADALDAAADRIDQAIEERSYVTPEVAADAERDSIRLRRTARTLRSLHPDIARVAAALADGLKVPDGWGVQMDSDGDIKVSAPDGGVRYVRRIDDRIWWLMGPGFVHDGCRSTPQAAVDAAIEALGGPR